MVTVPLRFLSPLSLADTASAHARAETNAFVSSGSSTLLPDSHLETFRPPALLDETRSNLRGLRVFSPPRDDATYRNLRDRVDEWFERLPERLLRLEGRILMTAYEEPAFLSEIYSQEHTLLIRLQPVLAQAVEMARIAAKGVPASRLTEWVARHLAWLMTGMEETLAERRTRLISRSDFAAISRDGGEWDREIVQFRKIIAQLEGASWKPSSVFYREYSFCPPSVRPYADHLLSIIDPKHAARPAESTILAHFLSLSSQVHSINPGLSRRHPPDASFAMAFGDFREGRYDTCVRRLETLRRRVANADHDNLAGAIEDLSKLIRKNYGV